MDFPPAVKLAMLSDSPKEIFPFVIALTSGPASPRFTRWFDFPVTFTHFFSLNWPLFPCHHLRPFRVPLAVLVMFHFFSFFPIPPNCREGLFFSSFPLYALSDSDVVKQSRLCPTFFSPPSHFLPSAAIPPPFFGRNF